MPDPTPTRTPWLRRDQWDLFRRVFAGDDELPASYDEWLRGSQDAVLQWTAAGFHIKRVEIDVEQLVAWCRRQRRPVDALAMMLFSGEVDLAGSSTDLPDSPPARFMKRTEHRFGAGDSEVRFSIYTPEQEN